MTATYPYFKLGLVKDEPSVRAELIPTLANPEGGPRAQAGEKEPPKPYVPSPELSHAMNVALLLGKPLLITGPPGSGKTTFAEAVAAELSGAGDDEVCELRKFETKSTSQARDLFYTYDSLAAFSTPPDPNSPGLNHRPFITYQALGAAILDAFDASRVMGFLDPSQAYKHKGPRRSVVLIDEIDKAPRDFPNDLLNEIDRMFFRVPELGGLSTPHGLASEYRPIVIITSNEERGLPDPFLRRCAFFDIPFPEVEMLKEIVLAHLPALRTPQTLLTEAVKLFFELRGLKLRKSPSTAELLNWLQVMVRRGATAQTSLKAEPTLVTETVSALVKGAEDTGRAKTHIEAWAKAPG